MIHVLLRLVKYVLMLMFSSHQQLHFKIFQEHLQKSNTNEQQLFSIQLKSLKDQTQQYQDLMEPPKSTVENSIKWRLWHGFNYFIGGGTFLAGSILLFPLFNDYVDAAEISGWLYTIGSGTFLLADVTEWFHYVYLDCRYLSIAFNFFINVIGSLLYLIGSACFIPKIGKYDMGMDLFIAGSFFIMVAQAWKLLKTFTQPGKSVQVAFKQDQSGVYVDFFAGAGALMYFCGTFVFKRTTDDPSLMIMAAFIYSLGGLFFFTSAAFIQKRYFWEKTSQKLQSDLYSSDAVSTQM